MKKFCVLLLLISLGLIAFAFINEKPTVAISRSLAFPVWGKSSRIESYWGDVRDGGKRKHEGIDIFAKKGTPVVAISDGFIISKGNTPRGGKTLWLQSTDHPWTAYYAHLDQQIVREGQYVKKGQVLGTVGNTGNARTTPAHLHFGIYTWSGAVNPLPYLKYSPRITSPLKPGKSPVSAQSTAGLKKTSSKAAATLIDPRYIQKKIVLYNDPSAKYYVTTRNNVVKIENNKLQIIGKWYKNNSAKLPYKIALVSKKLFYVSSSGKILSSRGTHLGTALG